MSKLNNLSDGQLKQLLNNLRTKNAGLEARLSEKKSSYYSDMNNLRDFVWPFWFSTLPTQVLANNAERGNVSITQESSFVVTAITRSVFIVDPNLRYVDPDDSTATGLLNDISVEIQDSQSSRSWTDQPIKLSAIGHAERPLILDSPYMMEPNNNVSVLFNNDSASNIYCSLNFLGYRVRMEDSHHMSPLVYKG